jgi:stearoyl-CoA desaturase (delta-9 desaturase)
MFLNSKLNLLSLLTILYLFSSIFYLPFANYSLELFLFGLFNFIWFGLSSSMYYHRCLTHRAVKLNYIVEIFFLCGGLFGLGGDPIKWVAIHRFHHQNSDADNDTHSPKHGFFWAYYGWVLHHDNEIINALKKSHAKDLLAIPHLRLASNVIAESLPHTIYSLGVLYFFGIDFTVVGIILPCLLSYHCHWMLIASLCHMPQFGYRRFDLPDLSRNIKWLSLVSFGESLHNNHHRYPSHLNLSSSPFEFDFSDRFVKVLELLKLATKVKRIKYES